MIIFSHIPKTAGNTLTRIVANSNVILAVNTEKELHDASLDWNELITVPYIGGHFRMPFIDELIANRRTENPLVRTTLLREPVARAYSLYLFLLRAPSAMPGHAANISGKSFEFFWDYAYENMEWHITDAQCYLICGDRSFDHARKSIDEHFDVVGISEDFPLFYNALRSAAPFARLPADYSDHIGNVAPAASSVSGEMLGQKLPDWRERISPSLLRRIERDNANDLELYDYVQRRGGLVTRALTSLNEIGPERPDAPSPSGTIDNGV